MPGKQKKEKRWLAGSFTLETAMLMPVFFAVFFTSLFYCFHTHNHANLYARCAEQAISGKEQGEPPLWAARDVKITVTDHPGERTVDGELATVRYTGEKRWDCKEKCRYEKVRPVRVTRVAHAVIQLAPEEG